MRYLVPLLFVVVAACGSTTREDDAQPFETMELPVSLYIVTSDGASSDRTVDELSDVASRMVDIWIQAGIELDIAVVGEIVVPADVVDSVAVRDGVAFLRAAADGRFEVPETRTILGFYVPDAGGANGFAPFGLRAFFVSDNPSVHDERVSSHEIGHILGLHHDGDDADRLMFSGTNGTSLSAEEIAAARYVAQGIIDGRR